jgi:hypothetical protein
VQDGDFVQSHWQLARTFFQSRALLRLLIEEQYLYGALGTPVSAKSYTLSTAGAKAQCHLLFVG